MKNYTVENITSPYWTIENGYAVIEQVNYTALDKISFYEWKNEFSFNPAKHTVGIWKVKMKPAQWKPLVADKYYFITN